MHTIGIYKITNLLNGKVYIGSSKNIESRFYQHKNSLKTNKHPSRHLQYSWNKYGSANFKFEIIELCDVDVLLLREQHWIDTHASYNYGNGYNLQKIAGSNKGIVFTPASRKKMSKSKLGSKNSFYGQHHGNETKENIGKYHRDSWEIYFPNGDKKDINSLIDFCKQHNLSVDCMRKVSRGVHKTHRGFLCRRKMLNKINTKDSDITKQVKRNSQLYEWKIIFPNKNTEITKDLKAFSIAHDLHYPAMLSISHGRQTQHRGFKCVKLKKVYR